MCSHMLLLTQFYANCAFETSNFENLLHLSIFMLLRAVSLYFILLTQFYSHWALKTFELKYFLDFDLHSSFYTLNLEKGLHLKHFYAS